MSPWLCLLLAGVLCSSHGACILGIFPTPSFSHQQPFQAVMKALASRGHQVTVISTDPLKSPHGNYSDIDLSFTYDFLHSNVNLNDLGSISPWQMYHIFGEIGKGTCHTQLSSGIMQDFIKRAPQFDLVILESLNYQSYYGLVHLVGSPPLIGLISVGALSIHYDAMGSYFNPAYFPSAMWTYGDHMTFLERANNMLYELHMRYRWHNNILPDQEVIMRQYFGSGPPSVAETDRNYSLIMTNSHYSLSYVLPAVPGLIELGTLHTQAAPKPLPKDLGAFLDGATSGFIYFSLGSNVRSDKMSEHKRQQFLAAFAELPQRVLWKWESDSTLPGQPDNVLLSKWLPQQDVLAHKNIRLFMTQGGLQSTQEAVNNAVPLVGIPFFGDQEQNVFNMAAKGVAVKLDFQTVTKESILEALRQILDDPGYGQRMKKLSDVSKDLPDPPLTRAVWWIEHVLRHNGASHLRSAALDLHWYQLLLLDVIAVIAVATMLAALVSYYVVKLAVKLAKKAVCSVGKMCGCSKKKNSKKMKTK